MHAPAAGTPLWHELTPSIPQFAPLPGAIDVDVAVVGAGLCGLTTALLLAEAGMRVAVVDRAEIGVGASSRGIGQVTARHGVGYADLVDAQGWAAATAYGRSAVAAVDRIRQLSRRHDITAGLEDADLVIHADDTASLPALEDELAVMDRLGLPVSWVDDHGLPWAHGGVIRLLGQAQFQPVAHLSGLARAVHRLGAAIFTHTTALDVHRDGTRQRLVTARGSVRADAVVVTAPMSRRGGDLRVERIDPSLRCAIAAPADHVPDVLAESVGHRPTTIRGHRSDDGQWVVVAGPTHHADTAGTFAIGVDPLATFAAHALGAGPVSHRWATPDLPAPGALPVVGQVPRTSVWVAVDLNAWGSAAASAAADVITDGILGRDNELAAVLDPRRRLRPPAARTVTRPGDVRSGSTPGRSHPTGRPGGRRLAGPPPPAADIRYSTDVGAIRSWARRHNLVPSLADPGEPALRPADQASEGVTWEAWAARLDDLDLAVLYQDDAASCPVFRIVPREG